MIGNTEALDYMKEHMGILPVIDSQCKEGLCTVAQDTYQYYKQRKVTDDLMGFLPIGMAEETSENWARYITGEISREELLSVYQIYWEEYSEQ